MRRSLIPCWKSRGFVTTGGSLPTSTKNFTESERSSLFVDTWGWLCLADAGDPAHTAVKKRREADSKAGRRWVTSDYVLDETITRIFARRPFAEARKFCSALFGAQQRGLLAIEPIDAARFRAAYKLRLRYDDKPRVSFTDLTSFIVMEELGIRHVLTGDSHFRQGEFGFITMP